MDQIMSENVFAITVVIMGYEDAVMRQTVSESSRPRSQEREASKAKHAKTTTSKSKFS